MGTNISFKYLEESPESMGVKRGLIVLAALILFFAMQKTVLGAHAICGFVNDASDGTSAAWRTFIIYYENDDGNNASCEISPENNGYCCDADEIPGHSWKKGDVIFGRMPDIGNGFYTDEANVTTTGEGFDKMPTLQMYAAIMIYSPEATTYYANTTELRVSTLEPYTESISYSLNNGSPTTLCNSCNETNLTFEYLEDNDYELTIFATSRQGAVRNRSIAFRIDAVNDPPYFASYNPSNLNLSIDEGTHINFSVNASDPNDNDVITIEWYKNNESLASETSNFLFETGYVGENSAGIYEIKVVISDGEYYESLTWKVNVNDINQPPIIEPVGAVTAHTNELLTLQINATDIDGDSFVFSDNTTLFDISESGLINFTPTEEGTFNVMIIATDTFNNSANISVSFTITTTNQAPIISEFYPEEISVEVVEGSSQHFSINGSDPDGTIPFALWYLDNELIPDETDYDYDYAPGYFENGSHTLQVVLSDGLLNDTHTWQINVLDSAYCGDSICEADENCETCRADCGQCAAERIGGGVGLTSIKYEEVEKALPIFLRNGNDSIAIKEIVIWPKKAASNVKISAERIDDIPEELALKKKAYQYIKAGVTNLKAEDIEKIRISFRIEKEWLRKKRAEKEWIKVYEHVGKWREAKITSLDEDEDYYYVEIQPTMLGLYTIVIEEPPREEVTRKTEEKESREEKAKAVMQKATSPENISMVITTTIIILLLLLIIRKAKKKQRMAVKEAPQSEKEAKPIKTREKPEAYERDQKYRIFKEIEDENQGKI
ncbi:PGF-pre-PGF domain-containing protein [Candidatus Woesearchaeota archaeon]|nr:MAG: PGF-pre-PGF domain-containing protein [Candidatus Woesearchaeota archaeon]